MLRQSIIVTMKRTRLAALTIEHENGMRVHIYDYERRTLAAGGHGSKWLRVSEMDEVGMCSGQTGGAHSCRRRLRREGAIMHIDARLLSVVSRNEGDPGLERISTEY